MNKFYVYGPGTGLDDLVLESLVIGFLIIFVFVVH